MFPLSFTQLMTYRLFLSSFRWFRLRNTLCFPILSLRAVTVFAVERWSNLKKETRVGLFTTDLCWSQVIVAEAGKTLFRSFKYNDLNQRKLLKFRDYKSNKTNKLLYF